MSELGLVSLEDLMKEIQSRFDGHVFIGMQKSIKPHTDRYYHHYNGDYARCFGLLDIMRGHIDEDYTNDDGEPE